MAAKNLYPPYVRTKTYDTGEFAAITQPNLAGLPITYLFVALEPVNKYESPLAKTSKWKLVINSANSTTDINQQYNNGTVSPVLTPTGIVPGSYTNVNLTVDAEGRIIAISNGGSSASGSWLTGSAVPDSSVGVDGQFYLLVDNSVSGVNNGSIYLKTAGTWNKLLQMQVAG